MKVNSLYLCSGLLSAAMLVGCGGSSGGGSVGATAANITTDNAKTLAVAATESSKSATASDTPTGFGSFGSPKTRVSNIANKAINLPSENTSYSNTVCIGGGTVDITGLENADPNATSFNLNMTFTDCDVGYGSVIQSGSASYSGSIDGGSYTITYNNLRITYNGQTDTINGSISCNGSGVCSENLTLNGELTGRTYQTENMQVSGNASSGYNVSGSVTDPDHGVIEISASGLIFNCTGGQPSSGSITVTGANTTLEVNFVSCSEFTVTLDGVPQTVLWADYGL